MLRLRHQWSRATEATITMTVRRRAGRYVIAGVLWHLAARVALGSEPINEENWLAHPQIVEIRELYRSIQSANESGALNRAERNFKYCEPYEDTRRVVYSDKSGMPRIYYVSGGSDDSVRSIALYYDVEGALRFAFITAGAFNGTKLEHRVYVSKTGEKLWEIQKLLEGPGYTFPKQWPPSDLVTSPLEAFDARSPCRENM